MTGLQRIVLCGQAGHVHRMQEAVLVLSLLTGIDGHSAGDSVCLVLVCTKSFPRLLLGSLGSFVMLV